MKFPFIVKRVSETIINWIRPRFQRNCIDRLVLWEFVLQGEHDLKFCAGWSYRAVLELLWLDMFRRCWKHVCDESQVVFRRGLCKGNCDSTSDGRRDNLVMSLADVESLWKLFLEPWRTGGHRRSGHRCFGYQMMVVRIWRKWQWTRQWMVQYTNGDSCHRHTIRINQWCSPNN